MDADHTAWSDGPPPTLTAIDEAYELAVYYGKRTIDDLALSFYGDMNHLHTRAEMARRAAVAAAHNARLYRTGVERRERFEAEFAKA